MRIFCITYIFISTFIGLYIAPPVDREEKKAKEDLYKTDNLTHEQAQDQEYFRYLTQVVGELEKDPDFKEKLNNATEDDIKSGKIADHLDFIGHNVRYVHILSST